MPSLLVGSVTAVLQVGEFLITRGQTGVNSDRGAGRTAQRDR
jgi:hypothetical protein